MLSTVSHDRVVAEVAGVAADGIVLEQEKGWMSLLINESLMTRESKGL